MDNDTVTLIIGVVGATSVLIAFLMNQLNKWTNASLKYDFVNFFGSVLLMVYAVLLSSIPFLILNTVWALFSLKDLIKKAK